VACENGTLIAYRGRVVKFGAGGDDSHESTFSSTELMALRNDLLWAVFDRFA
jgi:hypothetical protein